VGLRAADVDQWLELLGEDRVHVIAEQLENGLLAAGFTRSPGAHELRDHVPDSWDGDPAAWDERVFRPPAGTRPGNVHVRVTGRPNERYALLFRDFLTADRGTRAAWALPNGLIRLRYTA